MKITKAAKKGLEAIDALIFEGFNEPEAINQLHPLTVKALARQGLIKWDSQAPYERLIRVDGRTEVMYGAWVLSKSL